MRIVTWLVLPVFLIGILLVGIPVMAGQAVSEVLGRLNPFGTTNIDRTQPAVLLSIEKIERYNAAVGNFQVVVDDENDTSNVPDFIAGDRSLFVAVGSVDAYVDFSGLADGDVTLSPDGKTVTIELPAAQLDDPDLDQEASYLVTQERGLIDRLGDAISTPDQSGLYELGEQKIADAAVETELVQQAEDNTKDMLTGLVTALGLQIVFAEPAPVE